MVEKKKSGIFTEIILNILKFLPLMIIAAIACAMISFVLCSHFLNKEYVSVGSFRALSSDNSVVNEQAATLMKNNYDFYARVAGVYNTDSENKISAAYVKNSLTIKANDTYVKIMVSDQDPTIAFDILSAVRQSIDEHFAIFDSQIDVSDYYWDTQPSTHFSMNKIYLYLIISAALGFIIVFIIAIAKGIARGKISSVKEFNRLYRSDLCVVLPYVNNPVGVDRNSTSTNAEENDD